jgi:hypothetical protein
MGVASYRSFFLLSDVIFNRTFVSFRFGFQFTLGFRSMVACVMGFCPGPHPSPARPGLAQSGLALDARPLRPTPPMRVPPPLSLSQLFSRATTSSNLSITLLPPLLHLLCPRCDPVSGCCDRASPKVSPTSLSLSLFPSSPFSSLSRRPWSRALLAAAPPGRVPQVARAPSRSIGRAHSLSKQRLNFSLIGCSFNLI